MTPEQRARLAALVMQASQTQAEQTELDSLRALAAQNPLPAAVVPAAPAPAAAAPAVAAPAAPVAKPPFTLGSWVSGLRNRAGAAAELTAAQSSVAALTGERDQARADLQAVRSSLASATAQLGTLCNILGVESSALVGLDDTAIRARVESRINDAATSQLSTIGVPAANLPAPIGGNGDPKIKSFADFQALSNFEKMEFSRKGGRISD